MKVLATFDGSKCSEAILPQLKVLAALPDVEFTLLSLVPEPHATPRRQSVETPIVGGVTAIGGTPVAVQPGEFQYVEDLGGAEDRVVAERKDYLRGLVSQLPEGARCEIDAEIGSDAGSAIIRYALQHRPDVIVMGTHGSTGLIHRLFGDVAEQVVRSGVAPVLLVHPNANRP